MKNINVGGFQRIHKAKAKSLYRQGNTVYMIPVNMRPDNMFMPAMPFSNRLSNDNDNGMFGNVASTFEKRVNAYTYYNCNAETGKYPAFYIKEA